MNVKLYMFGPLMLDTILRETTLATPRYSASALDWDIMAWRLEDQDIRLSPRNRQKPDVDLRVSGQPTWGIR
ncbi:hypothetical protein LIER_32414 [Lithospermum erythrorhizon]|uniref:Uncharacterized protein n=1 Tax=Lithospermum erythrorhizon TaxID=34254 RepID=A0AAV3RZP7_LITER